MAYRGPDPKPESLTAVESLSGASVNITASNTSNTASSDAKIAAVVAGTSANDPYFVATVTGTASWSWGLDNSDSDKFKIGNAATLGSSTVITLTSNSMVVAGTIEAGNITTTGDFIVSDSGNLGTLSWTPTTTRTITIPDTTDTLVARNTTDTLTNKTLTAPVITSPVLTTPQINDTSSDHQYVFAVSELAADRTVTLPLLSGNDTFVFNDHTQTLTNKTLTSPAINTGTLTSPVINTSISGTAILDEDNMASDSATKLATQQSIKAYVDANASSNNILMNGAFDHWQRGNTVSFAGTNIAGPDRWLARKQGTISGTFNMRNDGTVGPTQTEGGFANKYHLWVDMTGTETPASGDWVGIDQSIEGYVAAPLTRAAAVTLSFWVKATKTGTSCVYIYNAAAAKSYVAEFTISTTDTWEYKTVTFAMSADNIENDTDLALRVGFTLTSGATYQTTAGAWQSGEFYATSNQVNHMDSTSNNFEVSQVKLSKGGVASAFSRFGGNYEADFQACQRYYQVMLVGLAGGSYSTTAVVLAATFPTMRTAPTIAQSGTITVWDPSTATYTQSSTNIAGSAIDLNGATLLFGNFTGMTAFRPMAINTGSRLTLNAEF